VREAETIAAEIAPLVVRIVLFVTPIEDIIYEFLLDIQEGHKF
jgi:hypothetical protein